ncbi:MAG TPA: PadR family transcriptional regulator [Kineosporiaceae bacterium]|nr:PadR family transcriptional regulator [Kineosporiaceae bacterium]
MSVRQSLLVLLAEKDCHGYQLRQEFEQRTGGTWPINIGQIYTTINRLQRDGLVVEAGRQDDGSVVYSLTDQGRSEAGQWWVTPVDRATPSREELAIKLALAVTSPGVDVRAVLQRQRTESLRALQSYTQHKRRLPDRPTGSELARLLVLDSLIYAVEAEVRWLDHIEQRLIQDAVLIGGGALNGRPDASKATANGSANDPSAESSKGSS